MYVYAYFFSSIALQFASASAHVRCAACAHAHMLLVPK